MTKLSKGLIATAAMTAILVGATAAQAKGRGDGPVIYVVSQGLYYDSIVTADPLPPRGPFQQLEMVPGIGLTTEYGPGDPQYVGGRWWMDANADGEMNAGDLFFSCPLLAPGRTEP
ncbi:MAG: hypothetical protein ACYTG3_18675 [Planctomycetota bacterium]|jgi:hypothetical protein